MDKHQKKQIKRYIAWGCLALLVALLAVMPLLASRQAEKDGPQVSILTTTVEKHTIDSQIIGGGQLTSEVAEEITIPEAVKLTKYLVGNGDTVKKGDPIARVDKVSVMLAISEVQETLEYLSEEIADASSDKESDKINAQTSGVVKTIYGKAGDSVRDVMLEHGALAVISLDDKMAVEIDCDTGLSYGNAVSVTLADGKKVTGTVESNILGTLLVTIEDKDYKVGETVTVSDTDGTELGKGELQIHSPWNVAAYYGTIKKVNVKAGDKVFAGKQLFQLEVGDHSAAFQILNTERQEYEELMQELFTMHSTGVLSAPCDGFVTGVDKDGTFLLAAESGEQSWFFQPLSNTTDSGWTVMLLSETNDPSTPTEPTEPATEPTTAPSTPTEPTAPTEPTEPVDTTVYYQVTNVDTVAGFVSLKKLNSSDPEESYPGTKYPDGSDIAKDHIVTLVGGVIQKISGGSSQMPNMGDLAGMMGGMASFGGMGGYGGSVQTFEPYSLETVTVASVTSQEKMTLEIAVDEQDITSLQIGQEATITVEALTGQSFPATITSISNTGTNEGGSSKFTVKLTLSKSGDMLPGMNASAFLSLQSQSVTAIPVAALVEEGGKTIVYTGYNEKDAVFTNPVTVTTGVSDGEYVQILSGLTDADTVYYAYYDTLEQSRTPDRGFGF